MDALDCPLCTYLRTGIDDEMAGAEALCDACRHTVALLLHGLCQMLTEPPAADLADAA